jgi:hypothetical protein
MKLAVPLIAATLGLAACASTPTVYGPAMRADGPGYSDYRIEQNRFRITFRGGRGAPPEQVADYALRRAADIALAEGFDWFQVTDRFMRQEGGYGDGPRVSVGAGGGSGGYRSGVGVGVGTSFGLGGGPALASTIEVLMGRGSPPPGVDVYDARDVARSLGRPI